MKEYQLYLENIINALARVGIHYPLKLESYEDLFYTSESLGAFLEINSFLQRVGEGYCVAGLDESITYRSYWYSEFYLEFQERVVTKDAYGVSELEEVGVVADNENLNLEEVEKKEEHASLEDKVSAIRSPFGSYSSVVGTTLDGFDSYGVPFDIEKEDDDSDVVEDTVSESEQGDSSPTPSKVLNYSDVTGTNSDGFDVYGVDLEDEAPEEEEEEVSELAESSDFDFPEEEVDDITSNDEVVTSATVSSDGFDLYGVELEDYDEDEEQDNLVDSDDLDPNNPENSIVTDLGEDAFQGEPEWYGEDYDEENDPNNPENSTYEELGTSDYEEYDEENDPNNPENSVVEEIGGGYEEYDDEDDPNNPENSTYEEVVEFSETPTTQGRVAPTRPTPKQVESPATRNIKSTQNILNVLGKFEKAFLGKVKKDGKN